MTRSISHRSGTLLALAAAVGFALQAIFATYAYATGMDPITLLVLRFILSAGAFWVIIAVRRPALPARRFLLGGLALGMEETDTDWQQDDADMDVAALPSRYRITYRTFAHDLTQKG